ncbi:MAG: T9SS type A sorting domain-containing protein [Crocinitomicaceae bacterium]|nr:T9SS type A sorting domain-containing protein [Crocinitomicaceae bacterium]
MKHSLLISFLILASLAKGQIWQSDFSNASEWISTDLHGGSDQWLISSTGIGGDVDTINSLSAGNGFAQFNSSGQCAGNHQDVVLTWYQLIDISTYELSYIEFVQHYKRKKDSVYVEFSADGFTWESIRINKEYWYNQQTDNPDTVRVSIPASVQAQPFYLRFRFTGDCGFAWLMDDMKIFEKEQFSMFGSGRITSAGHGYVESSYCFATHFDGEFILTNFGLDTLFNVNIQSDVFINDVFAYNQSTVIPYIAPADTLMVNQLELLQGPMIANYEYNIVSHINNSEITLPEIKDSIFITSDETSAYDGNIEGYLLPYEIDRELIGNVVIPTGSTCISSPEIYIPDSAFYIGSLVWAIIMKKNGANWDYCAMTQDYLITSADLGSWVVLGVDAPFPGTDVFFEIGDTCLILYGNYGSIVPIAYGAKNPLGTYYTDFFGNLKYDSEGHSAVVRWKPYIGCDACWESLDENNQPSISIYPNPANTKIDIEPVDKNFLSYSISSVDGRLICDHVDYAGESIPIDFLSNGIYILTVEAESGHTYAVRFVKE